jgi:hypothetical protein
MSKTLSVRRRLSQSPDQVLRLLMAPEFLVARHEADGAREVQVREVSRDGARVVQEVIVQEPAHTMTGVDADRLVQAVTTYEWDLAARRGRWSYLGPHGKMIRLGGEFHVDPDGTGAVFRADFEVTVRVPLLGSRIEKRIIDEIQAGQPKVDALVEEHLRGR